MRISILSSDMNHPVIPYLYKWITLMSENRHDCNLFFEKDKLPGGDFLFLVSCAHIVTPLETEKYKHTLVLHASDLPKDRGWSPHIWNIVAGQNQITVSLLEAASTVDTGRIWKKMFFDLRGDELLDEINAALFEVELDLMTYAVDYHNEIKPHDQNGNPGLYLKRRTPENSKLDITKTIEEQFNLLRVVDNERYPAYFDYLGKRYILKITKMP